MNTDTPRTDERVNVSYCECNPGTVVNVEFVRDLERELAAVTKERDESHAREVALREALRWAMGMEPSPCRCISFATPPHVCKGHKALMLTPPPVVSAEAYAQLQAERDEVQRKLDDVTPFLTSLTNWFDEAMKLLQVDIPGAWSVQKPRFVYDAISAKLEELAQLKADAEGLVEPAARVIKAHGASLRLGMSSKQVPDSAWEKTGAEVQASMKALNEALTTYRANHPKP